MFSTQCSIERCFQNVEVTDTLKDIHTDFIWQGNFIGLHFFDAIRIEAKSDSEETTVGIVLVLGHLTRGVVKSPVCPFISPGGG